MLSKLRSLVRDPWWWSLLLVWSLYAQHQFKKNPRLSKVLYVENSLAARLTGQDTPTTLWKSQEDLHQARRAHRVSVLSDGRVLVSGGLEGVGSINQPNRYLASSELFHPTTRQWTFIPNFNGRFRHTSTVLPSDEVVLIGGQADEESLKTTEIFDPHSERFRPGPPLRQMRRLHTATLLDNGRILVAGGYSGNQRSTTYLYAYGPNQLQQCEEIDLERFMSVPTASMAQPRELHTATRLADGRVLITGGVWGDDTLRNCELYDPIQRTWQTIESMQIPRARHTATLLPDGRVLVIGGSTGRARDQQATTGYLSAAHATCEIFDPQTGHWTLTSPMKHPRAAFMDAILLPNGKVLVGGGDGSLDYQSNNSFELYDIASGQWDVYGTWEKPISAHRLVWLPRTQEVLRIGGLSLGQSIRSCDAWMLRSHPLPEILNVTQTVRAGSMGPQTRVEIIVDFKGTSATLTPTIGPIESGRPYTFEIDRATMLTLRVSGVGNVEVSKQWTMYPVPPPNRTLGSRRRSSPN